MRVLLSQYRCSSSVADHTEQFILLRTLHGRFSAKLSIEQKEEGFAPRDSSTPVLVSVSHSRSPLIRDPDVVQEQKLEIPPCKPPYRIEIGATKACHRKQWVTFTSIGRIGIGPKSQGAKIPNPGIWVRDTQLAKCPNDGRPIWALRSGKIVKLLHIYGI
jgi:hypothetical protein